ncbi:uncharacterized protein [Onthophagus taurus]|uniref:uncharacterized protein isoform X1 n=1 Tax=Onthophagus taurus TaxID=166361 RepID=UPI0039BDAC8D
MIWFLKTFSKNFPIVYYILRLCYSLEENQFQFDVSKLSTLKHGSELVFLENGFKNNNSYKLEDFFWTGSGDSEEEFETKTSIIYETKTVLSTLFIASTNPPSNQTSKPSKCIINCLPPHQPNSDINPTSVYDYNTTENLDADRQFWLLTVLKSDGKDPVLIDLKNSLAKLYKKAFQRQQEKHLGINRNKRDLDLEQFNETNNKLIDTKDKPVKVYIHNVEKSPINGDEKIEVLYHVSVSGQPIPANTAADDMALISDEEVIQELGYPFLIKAEPYLKASEPQSLSTSKNTWLFIGSSLAAVFLLLLAVAFLSLCITKRKKSHTNMRQVFDTHAKENVGFVDDKDKNRKGSPTYIDFRTQTSNETLRSVDINRSRSSISSMSVSSSSLDVSPLMRAKPKQFRGKPTNKTVPLNLVKYRSSFGDSDSSEDVKRSENESGVISPKSYLSMPSVKSFPKCNIPEPLSKVLEPVSVLHLDLIDDQDQPDKNYFKRHGSSCEDPGVIGPVVWSIHQQKIQHGVSVDEGIDELKIANNVARMRKRFHDLLDDTFSLFGSRRDSPIDDQRAALSEIKSHSAINNRLPDENQSMKPRPKTSDPRRPPTGAHVEPRGAWDSHAPSPLARPLSAGVLRQQPKIDVAHILAEGQFKTNDPAVPLIAAIKSEIGKCSLPGSTTNLVGDQN